jgi:CubicO group peptidase (beta-lactamase class C family)
MNRRRFTFLAAASIPGFSCGAEDESKALTPLLEAICRKYGVPAVTGGLITTSGLQQSAAAGMRKAGGRTPVTNSDLWHLGSNTKAMTATLLATFVMENKLKWDAKLSDLLPELMQKAAAQARDITVRQLLNHRSGLPANADWGNLLMARRRAEIVRRECVRPLLSEPGTTYLYSNLGYLTAGVIAEKLGGAPWEQVITRRLFKPLGMKAGFGGLGTPGKEDQPWPHGIDGKPMPVNGPATDNPPALGPAGTCHMALAEYAKFVADHLRGEAGGKAMLPPALYKDLHTPPPDADYAMGWQAMEREWGGGTVLQHNGSNTMNFAVIWMAPKKGFAVVAACNQGGDAAQKACDDTVGIFLERHGNKK